MKITREIVETLKQGIRGDLNHCIPQCGALQLPDADLIVPPYVLGAWLGNGASESGRMSSHHDDVSFMREQFEADGISTSTYQHHQTFGTHGLTALLQAAGVLNNKHIPPAYLRASEAQRLALLQGLMDTDGGNDNASLVSFTASRPALADGFAELAVSLGQKVRRDDRIPTYTCAGGTHEGQRSYRIAFTPTRQVFRLPRKADRVSFGDAQALRRHHRMIVSAEPIHGVPMRCIAVDSPNSMYLAGEGMIPTHNTAAQVQWAWWEAWRCPGIVVHAISPTLSDVRGTIMEGPAGFCATIPPECLKGGSREIAYNRSLHKITLANGSLIRGFGAIDEASRLRGPQCHLMICDELREWDRPAGNLEQSLNNALFGLRLKYPDGTPSRAVMGTTPKPIPFLKRFLLRPHVRAIRGTSYENLDNLSDSYRNQLLSLRGTALGRQEIDGAFIDDEDDQTIVKRQWINLWPFDRNTGSHKKLPEFSFIIESYDTAASEKSHDRGKQQTDPTGCIVLGVFNLRHAFTEAELRKRGIRGKYACILLKSWAQHMGLPQLLEVARKQNRESWGPQERKRRSDAVLVEAKSSGPGVIQFLREWHIPVLPWNPRGDKLMRFHAVSPLVQQGLLWVPESSKPDRQGQPITWAEGFMDQVCIYSGEGSVEHDEYIDCLSQAFSHLRRIGILEATPEQEFLDPEEKKEIEERQERERYERERLGEREAPY